VLNLSEYVALLCCNIFLVANYCCFHFGVRHAFSCVESSLCCKFVNVCVCSRCFCGSLLFCYTMLMKQLETFERQCVYIVISPLLSISLTVLWSHTARTSLYCIIVFCAFQFFKRET